MFVEVVLPLLIIGACSLASLGLALLWRRQRSDDGTPATTTPLGAAGDVGDESSRPA